MNRKLFHYVASLLQNAGIQVLSQEPNRNNTLRTRVLLSAAFYYSLSIILLTTYAIKNRQDFYKFVNAIPYIAIVSLAMSSFLSIFCHKRILAKMLAQMDDNLYTYPDEDQLQVTYKWYLREGSIIHIIRSIQVSYFVAMFFRSFLIFINLSVSDSTETFFYPAWIPWPMDKQHWQYFTMFFQLGQGVCGIWCHNLVVVSIITVLLEFLRQYKRLEVAIGSLKKRTELTRRENRLAEIEVENIMQRNIIHCIRHHQKLYQIFQMFKIWMEIILSCYLLICMLSLAFGLYFVVNANNFLKLLNCFEIMGVIIVNLFAVCIVSEIFSNLNEGLRCTLFWEIDWYEMSEKNRKLLIIFHLMNCRPLDLLALQVFRVDRLIFSKMMRVTYSIFNVLNASIMK